MTPSNEHFLSARTSRRRLIVAGGALFGGAALAACGGKKDKDSTASSESGADDATAAASLYFANWPAYIDEDAPTTVDLFQEASGIKMKYTTEYNDNNEYFAKVFPVLQDGKTIDPDILPPTFWMAGRFITLGYAEKLPLSDIPNAANLTDNLVNPPWDPTGEYTLPWQSGMAGIAYNRKVTGRDLTTIDDLWDPAFKGKIGLLTEMRDTVGLVALGQGVDLSKPTFSAMEKALEILEKQVADGQVRQFTGNDYMDDLTQGNFAACVGWSGDIAQLSRDNPDVRFVVPESGGTLWSDVMLIPKGAKHTAAAAKWMDFVYDPVNAARITNFVQYVSPVKGVAEELTKMGGDAAALVDNPLIFPDEATLANLSSWGNLSEDDEAKLDAAFSKIAGN